MSSTKRSRTDSSSAVARPPKKSASISRRVASNPQKPVVRASALRVSFNGRIGRKKLRVTDTPASDNHSTSQQENCAQDTYVSAQPEDRTPNEGMQTGKKKVNTTSSKLDEWLQFRETCLFELIRRYGLGDSSELPQCVSCQLKDGQFRCTDCFPPSPLRCSSCFVDFHRENPLHRVEEWNGVFFEKRRLMDLGLRVQLGHGGRPCASPLTGPSNFVVFHVNGFHRVNVDFCGCHGSAHARAQLLRIGWFPATFDRPKTAFTFGLLDLFHKMTLQGKITLYDFYHAISQLTDTFQLEKPVNRYPEFNRVFRIWRHLKSLIQAGRTHDPAGVEATSQGELALECPACPLPGKNLPENWENAKAKDRFLYTFFFSIDANFKLKQKARAIKDIELAPGWGCYVESSRYEKHVKDRVDHEMNSCGSDHTAIARANMAVRGYTVNGVGIGICSRHSLIRGNSAVDLEKGEKFCSIDYLVLSALTGVTVPRIVISYDIGCQWSKNLQERISKYDDNLQLPEDVRLEIGIPNWHVNGHGMYCRSNYSLNYMPGVGRTCGEDIEICWSQTNALAPSTREMGSGARRETLNDHWNGWNLRKIVGFRPLFLKRFKDACIMRKKHADAFETFSRTFDTKTISEWTKMVEEWINDRTKPNPYEEPKNTFTLQDVRLELTKEDGEVAGSDSITPHKTSATEFLMRGLEIEERQRTLKYDTEQLNGRIPVKQAADLQERRNALYHCIQQWRDIQVAYTPLVTSLLPRNSQTVSEVEDQILHVEPAEEVPLFLPSAVPVSMRDSMKDIAFKELRLRKAQAEESLSDICRGRCIISSLMHFKKLNVCGAGNKPNTRMRALHTRLQRRIQRAVNRYQTAWRALHQLEPVGGDWYDRFRKLDPKNDIRGPGKQPDDPVELPNCRFEQSWIWFVRHSDGKVREKEFHETLRVEWAKMQARSDRWEEEYWLVIEEMRRTVAYLEWKAVWWHNQAHRQVNVDLVAYQGLVAYARSQGQLLELLAASCVEKWAPALSAAGINLSEWESYHNKEKPSASDPGLKEDVEEGDLGVDEEIEVLDEELIDDDDNDGWGEDTFSFGSYELDD